MVKLSLQNVDVSLPVFGPNGLSLRSKLVGLLHGGSADASSVEVVHAIRDMSIDLQEGDRIGLRGPNGAGKSTFLRLVGGIYQPTGGSMTVSGTRRCLFGLASGMEMEATGWENIRIGARRIGVPKSALDEVCDDVAEFSELGESLDRPIRTYSQGMLLRLGFGVMTSKPADIILIDEVIGVGDAKFMERANARMERFADQAKILILASHSNDIIEKFCNQILTFDEGRIAKRIFWDRLKIADKDDADKDDSDEDDSDEENNIIQIQESFCDAIKAAGANDVELVESELLNAKEEIRLSPFSPELHQRLGELYGGANELSSEWLQRKNVESLVYIAEGGDAEIESLGIEEPNILDFSYTRSIMRSLVELLSAKEGAEGVILSLNSPCYGYSSRIFDRKLLSLHADLNGVSDLEAISCNGRVQCAAVIGPSRDYDLTKYRSWLRSTAKAGIPYFAIWLRWTECTEVINAENALAEAVAHINLDSRYFSEADARRLAVDEGVSVEVIEEGRYLQAISEWLSSCPRGELDEFKYHRLVEGFYGTVYERSESLGWPHGYWVLFSTEGVSLE